VPCAPLFFLNLLQWDWVFAILNVASLAAGSVPALKEFRCLALSGAEENMADKSLGVGGVGFDASKRSWPNEINVLTALVIIVAAFEMLGQLVLGESFLFNTRADVDTLFNEPRLQVIILQVSIVGIIAIGVTQVIISGGIDLSSGSVVGATAMIAMSFAQTAIVNGNPNPKAIFSDAWMDLPVFVPIAASQRASSMAPSSPIRAYHRSSQHWA
jgi:hypothetical protein